MQLDWTEDEEAFRQEVRAFIATELTDDVKGSMFINTPERVAFVDKMVERGWLGMGFPEKYGGSPTPFPLAQFILNTELERAHAPIVGKNIGTILQEIDLKPPQGTQIAIVETNWDHPLVMAEQLMPVIPFVRCHSFEEAMEWAIISEHQYQHTFVMHSTNVARLSEMAQRCNANIFVKNGANMAGLGFGGEGYCTMSIAGTSGEGLTKASTFTRPRRCTLVDYFRIV